MGGRGQGRVGGRGGRESGSQGGKAGESKRCMHLLNQGVLHTQHAASLVNGICKHTIASRRL